MKEWKKGEKFYYIKRQADNYEICCTNVLEINRYDNHQSYVPRNDTAVEIECRDMFEQWADAKLSAYVEISVRTTEMLKSLTLNIRKVENIINTD